MEESFSLQTQSIDIVLKRLQKIDDKKATGLDKIPSKLLKTAASIIAPQVTNIFSKSILTGIYPSEWKTARVTPVFKKGIKSDPNNYRPISAIPIVSKVFEKNVYNQLYHYLNENKLLLSCQFILMISPTACGPLRQGSLLMTKILLYRRKR